jgi:nucleotide-binding universal stress UspA family protein
MTFVVPFDGSELAEAALGRAVEFGTVLEESVVAVTVIPGGNTEYARTRGWLGPDEDFSLSAVADRLRSQVLEIAPMATFEHRTVDRYAPSGRIASRIRQFASEVDATLVFLGSDNAGQLVTAINSVASSVAAGSGYDVVIVRQHRPLPIDAIEDVSPFAEDDADFYDDADGD